MSPGRIGAGVVMSGFAAALVLMVLTAITSGPHPPAPAPSGGPDLHGGSDGVQGAVPVAAALRRTPVPEPEPRRISGRVVDRETGEPVAGCEVVVPRFRWEPGVTTSDGVRARVRAGLFRAEEGELSAVTGADGRFEIELGSAELVSVRVTRSEEAAMTVTFLQKSDWSQGGPHIDLGDLVIPRGSGRGRLP